MQNPGNVESGVFHESDRSDSKSKMQFPFPIPTLAAIAVLFCCALIGASQRAELQAQTVTETEQTVVPGGCDLYRAMAADAVPSRERTFALRALEACPRNPEVARLLENAVNSDDFTARAAALASLTTHLDEKSIPFLVELYATSRAADLDTETETFIFEYLSRLATPAPETGNTTESKTEMAAAPTVPDWIFVQGLNNAEARIRQAALRGLGGLDQQKHWPLIEAVLRKPRSPGDRIAALQAARKMKHRDALQALAAARDALNQNPSTSGRPAPKPEPGLERAALELVADLGGPRALETLMIYDARQSSGPNRALVQKMIQSLADPKQSYALTISRARLHARASEVSPIDGVVARDTILYIIEGTGLGYRLPPAHERPGPESNWLRVRTTDGLAGWVHGSQIQRLSVGR